jgi:hypothetical protein
MAKPKKPFCKNGHEIALVGRYKSGACKECVRVYKINNIDKIETLKRLIKYLNKNKEK